MDSTLLCLACYEDRLASVFETAPELRLFRAENGQYCPAGHLSLPSKDPTDRTSAMLACGVTHLLCGAMCGRTRNLLDASGIDVLPWVRGSVEEVLEAYRTGTLNKLALPGCGNKPGSSMCRGRGRGGKGRRNQS
ncbi:NifB/NifX family molybdenum-iron cluster-binding protein [Salidesulfovibrio brasiliensis]|uniref:NifB/NifX family molybdenum-iron cluster-binding protein n=1 Tax=Salidesulfovibrio brasiliensis TaxID=221711 RepID=UPI0009F9885D|nr:NifB/NifX family molybdenum-iron cluster-binding protein [Salidesulfovibrio brasiliensis]